MSDMDQVSDTDQIFMQELKLEFMQTVAKNLEEMHEYLQAGNMAEIARVSHDIKGTSGIFGLDEGTEIARELNIAAKENDAARAGDILGKLTAYMKEQGIVE